jgi:hypothetical protein
MTAHHTTRSVTHHVTHVRTVSTPIAKFLLGVTVALGLPARATVDHNGHQGAARPQGRRRFRRSSEGRTPRTRRNGSDTQCGDCNALRPPVLVTQLHRTPARPTLGKLARRRRSVFVGRILAGRSPRFLHPREAIERDERAEHAALGGSRALRRARLRLRSRGDRLGSDCVTLAIDAHRSDAGRAGNAACRWLTWRPTM